MEATITNLVEPGDTIVVGNNGIWGSRVCDMAARYGGVPTIMSPLLRAYACPVENLFFCAYCKRCAGAPAANVVNLEKEAGKAFSFEELSQAVTQHKPAVLFLCQVLQKCPVQILVWVDILPASYSNVWQPSGPSIEGAGSSYCCAVVGREQFWSAPELGGAGQAVQGQRHTAAGGHSLLARRRPHVCG